jgi:hypothetical protein
LRLGRCAKDKNGKRISVMKKIITKGLDTGHTLVIPQQKSSQINLKNKSRQILVIT